MSRIERRTCEASGKQCYSGPKEARRAHRAAHYRIRVYQCDDCGAFHAANAEKRTGFDRRGERRQGDDRRRW